VELPENGSSFFLSGSNPRKGARPLPPASGTP